MLGFKKCPEWLEVSKDIRTLRVIAKEMGINEKTIRLNLKKRGLVKIKRIGRYSRNIQNYCEGCGKKTSRGHNKCISCGTKGKKAWNKGRENPQMQAEKSPHWKGGKRKHSSGYIEVYSPQHPHKNRLKAVLEHRLVVEKKIGRYLLKTEVVHHIDGNKQNNHIDNLMLFAGHREHGKFHQRIKQFGFTGPILREIENRW